MPGFNGLGPASIGPMTGKGRGYCIQEIESGSNEYGFYGSGRGMGRGFRRGRGARCWGLPLSQNQNQNKTYLKDREAFLKQELKMVENLLAEDNEKTED